MSFDPINDARIPVRCCFSLCVSVPKPEVWTAGAELELAVADVSTKVDATEAVNVR